MHIGINLYLKWPYKDVTLMFEIKPHNHERYSDMSISEYYSEAAKRLKKLSKMVEHYQKAIS